MNDDSTNYDIFSVDEDQETVWQCTEQGLWNAKKKMEEIARKKPGKYYIFSTFENCIVARFDIPLRGPVVDRRRLAK